MLSDLEIRELIYRSELVVIFVIDSDLLFGWIRVSFQKVVVI